MNPHTPKWTPMLGVGVPNGLPNLQSAIAKVKTHHLKEFFISFENYWNVDFWNGLSLAIWTSKTQVMAKRKAKSQTGRQFDSRPLKVGNWPDFFTCRRCATYQWKALDKGYNFVSDLITIRGFHAKFTPPKLRKSQLWEFRYSHLGVLGQKVIWMWPPWRGTKYTIKGKVVASPKSGSWWVLWILGCSWFVLAPKMF
jgi:hypothetical protein